MLWNYNKEYTNSICRKITSYPTHTMILINLPIFFMYFGIIFPLIIYYKFLSPKICYEVKTCVCKNPPQRGLASALTYCEVTVRPQNVLLHISVFAGGLWPLDSLTRWSTMRALGDPVPALPLETEDIGPPELCPVCLFPWLILICILSL